MHAGRQIPVQSGFYGLELNDPFVRGVSKDLIRNTLSQPSIASDRFVEFPTPGTHVVRNIRSDLALFVERLPKQFGSPARSGKARCHHRITHADRASNKAIPTAIPATAAFPIMFPPSAPQRLFALSKKDASA